VLAEPRNAMRWEYIVDCREQLSRPYKSLGMMRTGENRLLPLDFLGFIKSY
jgi:hypothetical protein